MTIVLNAQPLLLSWLDLIIIMSYIFFYKTSSRFIDLGEASVSVMWENDDWWHLPENIGQDEPLYTNADYMKHFLPDLKVIIILRNPSERYALKST